MKKVTVMLMFALAMAFGATAQNDSIQTPERETITQSIAVNAGLSFANAEYHSAIKTSPTQAATLRYSLDWNIGKRLSLSAQPELAYLTENFETANGVDHEIHNSWAVRAGIAVSVGYRVTNAFKVSLGVGGLANMVSGTTVNTFQTDAEGNPDESTWQNGTPSTNILTHPSMGYGKWIAQFEATYDINEHWYASVYARELFNSMFTPSHTIVMLGIGYNFDFE